MPNETTETTIENEKPARSTEHADKKEVFSREYVHELREENKNWRLKAQDAEKKGEETKADYEKRIQESQESVSKATQAAKERIIRAELKAHAISAGMIDLDGLKLADLSKIALSDDGEVTGATELMAELKEKKSYLFKENTNSTSTHEPPSKKPNTPKLATDMTDEEYQAARLKLTRK